MEQINEQWRPIEGYEGYEVSNLGKVRSLKYGKEKILNTGTNNKGYLQVVLYKEGKGKRFLIHRLVAYAFIPNPEGLPIINHRDENPSNNQVENLEWCTYEYNNNYGTRIERIVQTKINNGTYDPEMCGIIKNEGMKEYHHLRYQKNRDWFLEYNQNNREKIQEYHQEYYQNNRERLMERKREYYQNNRERLRERSLEYYKNNREKINSRRRKKAS